MCAYVHTENGRLLQMIGMIPKKSPYQFIQLQKHYSVNIISGTDFGAGLFYPLWLSDKNLLTDQRILCII